MVVGPVGSGKTSLLAALLGEVEVIKGSRPDVCSRMAYCAQVPWIMNATLEGNVKVGAADRGQKWYDSVVKNCCLLEDFDNMPARDQTEIGERGINLSGGQR